MKIKLFRSATVGIILKNYKILMDPWLTDGEYYGSWSHFPKFDLEKNLDEINSYNAIYISHIHPDHCSDETLKKIKKDIPVYIHSFHSKFLKFKIERAGFKVIELENNVRTEIAKNTFINVIAADNCDPKLCFKFTGCADLTANGQSQQIDTLSVIDDGKNSIMNINDCPYELATSTFKSLKKKYDKIDILLTGYGGAGPYPQCFDNLNMDEKQVAAKKKERQFLDQALNFIDDLKPNYYLPFAGTYTLSGKLSKLQDIRGVSSVNNAYEYIDNKIKDKKTKSIKINPGSTFDLATQKTDKPYKPIDKKEYKKYVEENLVNRPLAYEMDDEPNFNEIFELGKKAFTKFLEKKLINNVILESDIFIKVKDKSLMLGKNNKIIAVNTEDINKLSSKYVIFDTDIKLLKRLLLGPRFAHWNNAEIGSHIKFFRKPDVFERKLYYLMSYFHA